MGWSIGYDTRWQRDIGYGVPALCDEPDCTKRIDRGLAYVCGGRPYGGERGCGLYFCEAHLYYDAGDGPLCDRCQDEAPPYDPKPDLPEWLWWKLTDDSWRPWREEHPERVESMRQAVRS